MDHARLAQILLNRAFRLRGVTSATEPLGICENVTGFTVQFGDRNFNIAVQESPLDE